MFGSPHSSLGEPRHRPKAGVARFIGRLASLLVLASCLACACLRAELLVPIGAEWRYLLADTPTTLPPPNWTQPGFDDSQWRLGPSAFGTGYGGFPDATPIYGGYGQAVPAWFRRDFRATDVTNATWLLLRMDYDDAFVAYLNGQEVCRRNLPLGPTPSPTTFALAARARGVPEEIDLTAWKHLLHEGTNTLCVQLHNYGLNDYTFCLVPELMTDFLRGPFIQDVRTNRATVVWKTLEPVPSCLQFGLSPETLEVALDPLATTNHVVMLSNLVAGATYQYRIGKQGAPDQDVSPFYHFRTATPSGPVEFIVVGDTGQGSVPQYEVARQMRAVPADFVVNVGDVGYPFFSEGLADVRCFSVYQEQMSSVPSYFAFGNHDLLVGEAPMLNSFYEPTNDVTGTEHFYSFDCGDVHMAVMFTPFFHQHRPTVGDPQYRWLTNDLARSEKPWKFVSLHLPLRSSGLHSRDDYDWNGIPDSTDLENMFQPVFEQYGVQMVFAGHDHNYERFHPVGGVYEIVTAGGGVNLYYLLQRHDASSRFWLKHHFVHVSVNGLTLRLRAIDKNGQLLDELVVNRQPPSAEGLTADWHTPDVESGPATDGDGNILGQRFDLTGDEVAAVTGRFSNLGELRVNVDRDFVYLGLRQVSVARADYLALFLDVPDRPGVSSLAGLGNGRLDPFQEAADGLDLLESLRFQGFNPSVGLLLGDEFGDGQRRSFLRTGSAWAAGQGVFYLDPALSDVPGVQIQQFNLSPQTEPVVGEESADYIEVAIPRAAIGLGPDAAFFRIAGVVARPTTNSASALPACQIDSGFLGTSLQPEDNGGWVLAPLTVRLPADPDPDADGLRSDLEARLGTNPALADTDGDGLPDGWEYQHGLDPLSVEGANGALGDPDRDGVVNATEFSLGTDPWAVEPPLRLVLKRSVSPVWQLSWEALLGRNYVLEAANNPAGPYVNVVPGLFPRRATSATERFDDNTADTVPQRYYRLRMVP